jgi:hypothetical protein
MNCRVRYIGVVDKEGRIHSVEFTSGLNVITGKSSTGKSAMIEIFDHCLGSSDFTVPEGVITLAADIFFVVLKLNESHLVLARRSNQQKGFIRHETDANAVESVELFNKSYFDDDEFITMSDYRKEIGRFFDLVITDIDENAEAKIYKGGKSPTPSVRSFTSFMLQHQNLVANKHAIFYRFDEKEKRDQAIDHLPVFLGYADQKYFLLSQKLNTLSLEVRRLEQALPKAEEEKKLSLARLEDALREYVAVTGVHMVSATADVLLLNPAESIRRIRDSNVRIDGATEEFAKQRADLDRERSSLVAQLRRLERQHAAAISSVQFADRYRLEAASINVPTVATLAVSECPFCHTRSEKMEDHANKLQNAIEWLNEELSKSAYMRQSFEAERMELESAIAVTRQVVRGVEGRMRDLDDQVEELNAGRPLNELAIRAKVRAETVLEDVQRKSKTPLQDQIAGLRNQIKKLNEERGAYGMTAKLKSAREFIEKAMSEWANRFDFEESYKPLRLRFSLDSFDLWHEKVDGTKVFLRAMGSGANWLYCHLTLFLALHKLFCHLDKQCKIPPILFLDQPSQVYFPSVIADEAPEFQPEDLAAKAGKASRVDEDMEAVENTFSQLVKYCNEVKEQTGQEPQIIITDHADKLELEGDVDFESFVRARWRTRGFIDPSPAPTSNETPPTQA